MSIKSPNEEWKCPESGRGYSSNDRQQLGNFCICCNPSRALIVNANDLLDDEYYLEQFRPYIE